jgi:hypothetical protein
MKDLSNETIDLLITNAKSRLKAIENEIEDLQIERDQVDHAIKELKEL